MPEAPPAIQLDGVAKIYRLYDNPTEQALDVFGLSGLRFWRKPRYHEHAALDDISLTVGRGERLGVIGRNGAGKTTLLKLITGNFAANRGSVRVNGSVQALINIGLGFHPEFTGFENIRASLVYNGLGEAELKNAIEDIVEFVELGEYLHQPIRTYSLGMQSRLYFATATAVRPDILIIDEVLGAGDAYFSAKSADRMKRLTSSGATLLLVSHSMTQVLQFCDTAIWLEEGRIVLRDAALTVVNAYDKFMVEMERRKKVAATDAVVGERNWLTDRVVKQLVDQVQAAQGRDTSEHEFEGGRSQWVGAPGPRIRDFAVRGSDGELTAILSTGQPASFVIDLAVEEPGIYPCIFVIVTCTLDGNWLTRHVSVEYRLDFTRRSRYRITLRYDRLLLGNGSYLVTVANYKVCDLKDLSTAEFYEVLNRSYRIHVRDALPDDATIFHHPESWSVEEIESDDHVEEVPAVQSDALSQTPAGTSSPAIGA